MNSIIVDLLNELPKKSVERLKEFVSFCEEKIYPSYHQPQECDIVIYKKCCGKSCDRTSCNSTLTQCGYCNTRYCDYCLLGKFALIFSDDKKFCRKCCKKILAENLNNCLILFGLKVICCYNHFIYIIYTMSTNSSKYYKKYKKYKMKYLNFKGEKESNNGDDKIKKNIHKIAKSEKYVCAYFVKTKKDFEYKKYKNCRKHIHKLATSLKPNQWINISMYPFSNKKIKDEKPTNKDFKPRGVYFSKGGWLFHDLGILNKDAYINIASIDHSSIKIISTMDEALKFTDKYGYKKTSKTPIVGKPSYYYEIKWNDVSKKYKGFILLPNIAPHVIKDLSSIWYTKLGWVLTYDVATLVLWNSEPIIKYKTLFKMGDVVSINKIFRGNSDELTKLVDNIIKKIKVS